METSRMLSISESLAQEINKIKEITESGACIVVEGKRDEETMRDLGVDTTFYHVSGSGKPLAKLAEELSMETEVIILTDFDHKGSILASKIVELLHKTARKTKINLEMRRNFMNCMKKAKVGEVQDLRALVHKGDDINGENWNSSNKIHNKSKDNSKWSSRKT